ncbi:Mpo1-like protein [Microbulbifer sp. SSSA002]|uniref:Mpo1-like protein n=1 Tax=Microbulbifer sp. SSSA002 TaxID=3243376 RepID=UPI0040392B96
MAGLDIRLTLDCAIKIRRHSMAAIEAQKFESFREFYPFYLQEHSNLICRRLHFLGTSLVFATILAALVTSNILWLAVTPVAGYGLAWIGHFFFENNRPATFKYPVYSFIGDFVMFKDILLGRIER